MQFLIEMIGWFADVVFIVSYLLVSAGKLKGESRTFNLMNLAGAVLYGTYAILRHTTPVVILEVFWASIAILAIYKTFRKQPGFKYTGLGDRVNR